MQIWPGPLLYIKGLGHETELKYFGKNYIYRPKYVRNSTGLVLELIGWASDELL
jgi:hypothetical protein